MRPRNQIQSVKNSSNAFSPEIATLLGGKRVKNMRKACDKVKHVKFTCENYIFKFHMLFEM